MVKSRWALDDPTTLIYALSRSSSATPSLLGALGIGPLAVPYQLGTQLYGLEVAQSGLDSLVYLQTAPAGTLSSDSLTGFDLWTENGIPSKILGTLLHYGNTSTDDTTGADIIGLWPTAKPASLVSVISTLIDGLTANVNQLSAQSSAEWRWLLPNRPRAGVQPTPSALCASVTVKASSRTLSPNGRAMWEIHRPDFYAQSSPQPLSQWIVDRSNLCVLSLDPVQAPGCLLVELLDRMLIATTVDVAVGAVVVNGIPAGSVNTTPTTTTTVVVKALRRSSQITTTTQYYLPAGTILRVGFQWLSAFRLATSTWIGRTSTGLVSSLLESLSTLSTTYLNCQRAWWWGVAQSIGVARLSSKSKARSNGYVVNIDSSIFAPLWSAANPLPNQLGLTRGEIAGYISPKLYPRSDCDVDRYGVLNLVQPSGSVIEAAACYADVQCWPNLTPGDPSMAPPSGLNRNYLIAAGFLGLAVGLILLIASTSGGRPTRIRVGA
jgi:hypothetical protein